MAKTVAYVQEHGYDSLDALETSFLSVKDHTDTFRKNLKSTEKDLREINEQLHYTGQYLANKAISAPSLYLTNFVLPFFLNS